jgi:hypothetical protein
MIYHSHYESKASTKGWYQLLYSTADNTEVRKGWRKYDLKNQMSLESKYVKSNKIRKQCKWNLRYCKRGKSKKRK